ncbi:hypothetical protein K1719_045151 [Acacia pycnantha]|nr:hypothetical protein K1719_045151 [Acacia pycnantha]
MPEPPSSSLSSSAHTNLDSFNSVLQCSVFVATHDSVGRVISHHNWFRNFSIHENRKLVFVFGKGDASATTLSIALWVNELCEDKSTKIRGQCPVDHVIFDLAKFIGREKVPSKVLKDVGELTSQTLSQAQNHQPLSGSTIFNRIEIPASSDPSDLEFYEYVEAFKLIGDPYVPAGRYCFGLLYV